MSFANIAEIAEMEEVMGGEAQFHYVALRGLLLK